MPQAKKKTEFASHTARNIPIYVFCALARKERGIASRHLPQALQALPCSRTALGRPRSCTTYSRGGGGGGIQSPWE